MEPSDSPRQLAPRWLRETGITIVALIVGVPLAAVALLIAVVAAPYILAVITWTVLYRVIVQNDRPPYAYTRFGTALLVAWVADLLLFRMVIDSGEHYYYFAPAVIVVSAFVGFCAWTMLPATPLEQESWRLARDASAEPSPRRAVKVVTKKHPFAGGASFLMMLFAMTYLVTPLVRMFFPTFKWFWN